MKVLLVALMSLHAIVLFGQKSSDFSEVLMEELTMKNVNYDSTAKAAVLFDKGETVVDLGSTNGLTLKIHKRIKIFKKQAFDYANINIPVGSSGLSKLKASTYNLENGVIVESKLDKNSIFKVHLDKYRDQVNFTLPNVKEGSVIEFSYTISNDAAYIPSWVFQSSIPTLWSEYSLMVPPSVVINSDIRGFLPITEHESKSDGKYQKWIVKNVPAFREEPWMPHESGFMSSINFWIVRNLWIDINTGLDNNKEGFSDITFGLFSWRNRVREITDGMVDVKQKIKAISNYLKENIQWDGTKDFLAIKPDDLLRNKKGSSGDINLLFGSMLQSAGIETDFVLLSTTDNGPIRKEFSALYQFNYVICMVKYDESFVFLDATEKYLPFDVLPQYCLNRSGLVISKKNHGWIVVVSKVKAKTIVSGDFVITNKGDFEGKLSIVNQGYDAYESRLDYNKGGEKEFSEKLFSNSQIQISKSDIQNIKDVDKPVKAEYDFILTDQYVVTENVAYINPIILLKEVENPFKLDERIYPIDFIMPVEKFYLCNFTIPDGYTVEELPQNKIITLPNNTARYTFNISQTDNRITLISSFQINTPVFMQNEYTGLKEFYNRVIAKQTEQIVLKRN
jgi:hypothetical protein